MKIWIDEHSGTIHARVWCEDLPPSAEARYIWKYTVETHRNNEIKYGNVGSEQLAIEQVERLLRSFGWKITKHKMDATIVS